jgi:hypothetical protein
MQTEPAKPKKTRYLFSGSANAIAVTIHKPSKDLLSDAPSGSLPVIGGHVSHVRDSIHFGEIVRAKRASIDIVGERRNVGADDDHFITSAVSALEDVNILSIITADAIVGKVTSIYPRNREAAEGYHRSRFSFSGSHFDNLRINGKPYDFVLDQKHSATNYRTFRHDECFLEPIFEHSDQQAPPILEIPELGKLYLGEMDVFRTKATLVMLRLELGSPYEGELTLATNTTNGHDG